MPFPGRGSPVLRPRSTSELPASQPSRPRPAHRWRLILPTVAVTDATFRAQQCAPSSGPTASAPRAPAARPATRCSVPRKTPRMRSPLPLPPSSGSSPRTRQWSWSSGTAKPAELALGVQVEKRETPLSISSWVIRRERPLPVAGPAVPGPLHFIPLSLSPELKPRWTVRVEREKCHRRTQAPRAPRAPGAEAEERWEPRPHFSRKGAGPRPPGDTATHPSK